MLQLESRLDALCTVADTAFSAWTDEQQTGLIRSGSEVDADGMGRGKAGRGYASLKLGEARECPVLLCKPAP